jgi:plastocyanin
VGIAQSATAPAHLSYITAFNHGNERHPMKRTLTLFFLAALCISGCKKSTTPDPTSATPSPAPKVDPATAATISGTVHFDGKAPTPVSIDMSMDPACAMSATPNSSEQVLVADHALANVYIYIKSGAPSSSAPANATSVVLDQKGCRYTPHVIALQQGGAVEFHNSDPTMHNIHTAPTDGSTSVDVSQSPMGPPQTQKFDKPQTMLPVRCNNHPWMQAFINVSPNPYFTVTAANGTFILPSLPPGTYTVAAVHETLGEKDMQITVAPKSAAKADFTFAAK